MLRYIQSHCSSRSQLHKKTLGTLNYKLRTQQDMSKKPQIDVQKDKQARNQANKARLYKQFQKEAMKKRYRPVMTVHKRGERKAKQYILGKINARLE